MDPAIRCRTRRGGERGVGRFGTSAGCLEVLDADVDGWLDVLI
jgi:hypothetical protein